MAPNVKVAFEPRDHLVEFYDCENSNHYVDRTDSGHRSIITRRSRRATENSAQRQTACKTLDQELRTAQKFREIVSHQPIAGVQRPALLSNGAPAARPS
jgi:hypothetical protein